MSIDLSTIKRGNNLLNEKTPKKKPGRKKIENKELKLTEKVVSYISPQEKKNLEELVRSKGLNIAQYVRMLLIENNK